MINKKGIDIQYEKNSEGNISCRIEVSENLFSFPLTVYFCHSGPGSIFWSCSLDGQGHWCVYDYAREMDIRILDSNGEMIYNLPWDLEVHGDVVENKFISWCRNFKGKNRYRAPGMVIGAHRGFGEWENAYNQDLIGECLLIEPNESPFHELVSRFQEDSRFSYRKCLVSDSGGDLEFFTNGSGDSESSSLSLDHLANSPKIEGDKIISKVMKSFTVEDLSKERKIKWIHIDAEGYDSKIILSIPDKVLAETEFIIWEHLFLDPDQRSILNDFLTSRNFLVLEGQAYNSCAFKPF